MKGQNDGVENEKQIVDAINERQIKRLAEYQKRFIHEVFVDANDDEVVHAKKVGGQGYKPDVEIEINNLKYNVSVKKGGGNSVHQEKTDYFIHYCMKFLGMTEEERESLLLFLYGDGTVDGDSIPEERLKDEELVETYKNEIEIVQKFLDRNKRNLLERFLIYGRLGRENNIKADYIYHGDAIEGAWCPLDFDTIDYLSSLPNSETAPLSIGPLTIQVWNRNLTGKPELENRRNSIQVKWGACKTYVQKINELNMKKMKEQNEFNNSESSISRTAGDNHQGFENQDNIISMLNNSRMAELPFALKNLVIEIYPNIAASEVISATKISGNDVKPRIVISVNGEVKNLTVFMGSGNSVHQEKLDKFLEYCREELSISEDEEIALLTIMYGDGSLDGKSDAKDRLKNTEEVKEKYGNQVDIAQDFFNRHKRELVERFLIYGKGGKAKNIKADYIYYGTDTTGRTLAYPTVIEYIVKEDNSESALLSLGALTVQPWNRNPEAKPNLEDRRNSIQIKWGGMKQDMAAIYNEINDGNKGTADGDWEEYELVSKLNRDKRVNNRIWSILCDKLDLMNLEDVYAIRVSNMVYSKLSERVVLPKADVYLVKGKINHQVLLNNNYWLDEDAIEGLKVAPIENSGISCKRPNSSNFTYAKFTIKSFVTLFANPCLGAGVSLFVTQKDIDLNEQVTTAWGISAKELLDYYSDVIKGEKQVNDIETAKVIKKEAISKITKIIKENSDIAGAIFYGKGLFEEPYTANFLYAGGNIGVTYVPEFSITTGSGRHRGIYTIVIKP